MLLAAPLAPKLPEVSALISAVYASKVASDASADSAHQVLHRPRAHPAGCCDGGCRARLIIMPVPPAVAASQHREHLADFTHKFLLQTHGVKSLALRNLLMFHIAFHKFAPSNRCARPAGWRLRTGRNRDAKKPDLTLASLTDGPTPQPLPSFRQACRQPGVVRFVAARRDRLLPVRADGVGRRPGTCGCAARATSRL